MKRNMVIEVNRQQNENNQSLIRRFTKSVKKSGVLIQARKIRYRIKPKSDQLKKKEALKKKELSKEYQEKRKLGKITNTYGFKGRTRK
jgi:ribosomal protein S21